jgi:hypothetical protein
VSGFCEHGNEHSGSTKDLIFVEQVSDCRLLGEDFTDQVDSNGNASYILSIIVLFECRQNPALLTEGFRGSSQFLQECSGIVS